MSNTESVNPTPIRPEDPEISARRAELLSAAREAVMAAWPAGTPLPEDLDQELADIVDGFVVFLISGDPPDSEEASAVHDREAAERIYLKPSGFGGGSSRKFLNVGTNMKSAMGRYLRYIGVGAGLAALAPWLALISVVAIAVDVWGDTKIQVTERQAAVLWVLYSRGINERDKAVSATALRALMDKELASYGRDPMPRDELAAILPPLKKIRCVSSALEVAPNGEGTLVWWLNEHVEVDLSAAI